jgi:hypothetical protein
MSERFGFTEKILTKTNPCDYRPRRIYWGKTRAINPPSCRSTKARSREEMVLQFFLGENVKRKT